MGVLSEKTLYNLSRHQFEDAMLQLCDDTIGILRPHPFGGRRSHCSLERRRFWPPPSPTDPATDLKKFGETTSDVFKWTWN